MGSEILYSFSITVWIKNNTINFLLLTCDHFFGPGSKRWMSVLVTFFLPFLYFYVGSKIVGNILLVVSAVILPSSLSVMFLPSEFAFWSYYDFLPDFYSFSASFFLKLQIFRTHKTKNMQDQKALVVTMKMVSIEEDMVASFVGFLHVYETRSRGD